MNLYTARANTGKCLSCLVFVPVLPIVLYRLIIDYQVAQFYTSLCILIATIECRVQTTTSVFVTHEAQVTVSVCVSAT